MRVAVVLSHVEVEIFAIDRGHDELPHEKPEISLTVGFPPGVRRRYGLPVMLGRLFRATRRADVIISGGESGGWFALALLAAKAGRRPIVASVQNVPPGRSRRVRDRLEQSGEALGLSASGCGRLRIAGPIARRRGNGRPGGRGSGHSELDPGRSSQGPGVRASTRLDATPARAPGPGATGDAERESED
jgi:hypothetical protein